MHQSQSFQARGFIVPRVSTHISYEQAISPLEDKLLVTWCSKILYLNSQETLSRNPISSRRALPGCDPDMTNKLFLLFTELPIATAT